MKHLDRRAFLMGTSALPLLAMAGCATPGTTTPGTNPVPVWVALFKAVATEIVSVVPQLEGVTLPNGQTLVSSGTATRVQTYVNDIVNALSVIGDTSTSVQGKDVLAQVEGYINGLAPLVLPFASMIPGGSIIGLIIAALPGIEAAINFILSLLSPAAQQVAATAPPVPASVHLRAARLRARGASVDDPYVLMLLAAAAQRAQRHYRARR